MFRKISLIVISLTCFNVAADCNDDANAARLDNRLDEAEALLANCLDAELGRLARTYMLLGLTHYDNGDHKKAIAQYNKALETVPTYVTALTNRGLSYALSRNMKAAYKDFAAAIESNPEYMRAHYYHAFALAKDGRKQDAINEYSVALQVAATDTDRKRVLYQRGILYRELDQHDGAMADFGAAIVLDPNYVEAYFSRALALQQADQAEAAMADYSKVIELDPEHAEAHHNRGLLHKKAGAHHLAIRDYSKALDIKPGYGRAQVNRGYAFMLPIIPLLVLLFLG